MNINEIAELSGVSRATVSRYLNDGYVSEEKRAAIRKVIEDTGYRPSQQARNLRSKVTKLVGVIIPEIESGSVSQMVSGISEVLSVKGYQLLLADTRNNTRAELKYLRIFEKNQVDGIIFMGTMLSREHLHLMEEVEVPIVVTAQEIRQYSCVFQDDYHAAYDAAKMLTKKGRHIAYIGEPAKDKAAGKARKSGFLDAMADAGIRMDRSCMYETELCMQGGYEKAAKIWKTHPEVDSLFCATDSLAVGALRYFHEHDIQVPQQVQIVAFGDTEIGSAVSPAISSVHFYHKTMGQEVARMLVEILESGDDLKKHLKMGYQIVKKESLR